MILQSTTRSIAVATLMLAASAGSGNAQSLDDLLEELVEDQIQAQVESALLDSLEDGLEDRIEESLDGDVADALAQLGDVVEIVPAAPGEFVPELDERGDIVERDVWVLLVTPDQLARVQAGGFTIRERRKLVHLGRVLLRVDVPEDDDAAEARLEAALATPGVEIDLNHVYRQQAANGPKRSRERRAQAKVSPAVAIVDSAVDREHEALRRAEILQEDFVAFDRPRPTAHGTAVASILVGASTGRIFVASVFFEDDRGDSIATTTGLVRALDWAASTGVRVVNMSLSGPPNRVLEAALAEVVARGVVVVAAVGNDGPAGRPLYPAAYDSVIGVTAVDDGDRVYRYANRGRQVTFAAPGVEVVVAGPGGGYDEESGTSMAAPHVSAIVAAALAAPGRSPERVLAALKAAARDLGDPGFDEVYGFGRIVAIE